MTPSQASVFGPGVSSVRLVDRHKRSGVTTSFIDPGAPWQNAFVESFNGRMREELLNLEVFDSLYEAKVLIEDWRIEYNEYRPHRSLWMLTPSEFAARWNAKNEARLS